MSLPPRPRGPAPVHGGYNNLAARSSSPVAQFAGSSMAQASQGSIGCEGHMDLEWIENREVGLVRHRVNPPTDFHGQPLQAPSPYVSKAPQLPFPDAAHGVIEELSGAMDSQGYFTGLITNGLGLPGQFENPPPAQEVVAQDEVVAIGKENQKRTKNFTILEDEQLVKSWLNVSLDPVKGVNQSGTTYWKRIHAHFHAHKNFSSDRTQGSLMNRWSGISLIDIAVLQQIWRWAGRNQFNTKWFVLGRQV